jgi:hypothetical protein
MDDGEEAMRFRRAHRGAGGFASDRDPAGVGLVEEVEDFLAGRTAFRLAMVGDPVPAWTVVNSLAHAEPGVLRVVANERAERHPSSPTATLAHLAHVVVDGRADDEVRVLQRTLLVPLELGVLNTVRCDRLTNAQVEAVVVAMLGQWSTAGGDPGRR